VNRLYIRFNIYIIIINYGVRTVFYEVRWGLRLAAPEGPESLSTHVLLEMPAGEQGKGREVFLPGMYVRGGHKTEPVESGREVVAN
jgi:hypothetical protein